MYEFLSIFNIFELTGFLLLCHPSILLLNLAAILTQIGKMFRPAIHLADSIIQHPTSPYYFPILIVYINSPPPWRLPSKPQQKSMDIRVKVLIFS